jgi:hypothetical protein
MLVQAAALKETQQNTTNAVTSDENNLVRMPAPL